MNILVFCPNWIGDAAMATPALRALRRRFSDGRIVGIMRPVISELLEGLPYLDERIVWDPRSIDRSRGGWGLMRALRRQRFDLAVLLTNSFRSAALAFLAGARRRVGYRRDRRGWLLTETLEPARAGRRFVPSPIVDYYLRLSYYLGAPPETYRLELCTSAAHERQADAIWHSLGLDTAERVVVLNPGAAYGSAKCWPPAHFGELAERLAGLHRTQVLVLCGPAETSLAREVVKRAGRSGVHCLADFPLSIGLSKACVRRANLLVTTDSGPRHFAAAFDVPVVTLFGPTHAEWSETYFLKAAHLQKKVPCGPCQLRECPLDHRCMTELGAREVFETSLDLLERFGTPGLPARRSA